MPKYVLAYRGGGGIPATPEAQQAAMAEWGAWYGVLGAATVDGGAPFSVSSTIPAGTTPAGLSGYTVIEAESLESAASLAEGCPVLGHGGTIDVLECIDMSM